MDYEYLKYYRIYKLSVKLYVGYTTTDKQGRPLQLLIAYMLGVSLTVNQKQDYTIIDIKGSAISLLILHQRHCSTISDNQGNLTFPMANSWTPVLLPLIRIYSLKTNKFYYFWTKLNSISHYDNLIILCELLVHLLYELKIQTITNSGNVS